jgi:hypothetical protein
MSRIFCDDQREVKKYLLAFRWSNVMLFPILREVGLIPLETF